MHRIFIFSGVILINFIICAGLLFPMDSGNSSIKMYNDANNAYSFFYPSVWDFKEDKDGQSLAFKNETGDNASIQISIFNGESYSSSSGKWGVFTYQYNSKNKIWKITSPSDSGKGSNVQEIQTMLTKGGLPYTVEDRQNIHTFIFALRPGIYVIAVTLNFYPETQRIIFIDGIILSSLASDRLKEIMRELSDGLGGIYQQNINSRTKEEVEASKKKNVVDYFLLCTDIIPYSNFNTPVELPYAVRSTYPYWTNLNYNELKESIDKGFNFRKSLLSMYLDTASPSGLIMDKREIDIQNGYISMKGHNKNSDFLIKFVYFIKSDGTCIPAFYYTHNALEEHISCYTFYEGKRIMKNEEIISGSPFDFYKKKFKELEKYSETNVYWSIELPRYGTTASLFMGLETAEMAIEIAEINNNLDIKLGKLPLDLVWDQSKGRFDPRYSKNWNDPSNFVLLPGDFWAAVFEDDMNYIDSYVKKGGNINIKHSIYGFTPLTWAASYGHEELVKFLIKSGAGPQIKDGDGKTALDKAKTNHHDDIVKILEDAEAR